MDHKEELDLESIVKEFSEDPTLDDILREFAPEEPEPPAQSPSGDTVRLDSVQSSVRRRISMDHTQPFRTQFSEEEIPDEPKVSAPKQPAVEPFSEDWEPEYEEPMGNYTPRQPIVFQSRDRLRQLREKLVAGPEKRYYELAEDGIATLRLSAFINLLVFLASACITLAYTMEYIGPNRIRLVVFCQLLAILVSALLSHGRLLDGLTTLLRGRFTLYTLLSVTFAVCCVDGLVCLDQERISCCSIFCLQAALSQWAACHSRQREMLQMDTLRKASELTAVVRIEDYWDGISGYVTTQGEPESFTEQYQAPSGPERSLNIYGAVSLVFSTILAIAMGMRSGWAFGLQVMTAALLVSVPATAFISMYRPEAILQKRLHALGTVLCGWQGVKAVDKQVVFPISHKDLFPSDTIRMNGMKFYGSADPDMVICYVGSLISHEGGSLTAIFDQLMAGRYIRHAPVEEFGSYPGGLSALVDGEPVAVGTLEFMGQMDIQVPKEARIPHAVYAAMDGVLSGVFAMQYSRSKPAAAGLRNLCSHGRLSPVLISRDFMLTARFLREKLKVNAKRISFPDGDTRLSLSKHTPTPDAAVVALTVREGLPQRSFAITGAWALRSAQTGGAVIHILGGALGIAAVTVLALVGASELLTPANLLLYSLVWMIPGFLITEWTRYI